MIRNNKTLIRAKLRAYRQSRLMSLNIHHLNTMYHYVPQNLNFSLSQNKHWGFLHSEFFFTKKIMK